MAECCVFSAGDVTAYWTDSYLGTKTHVEAPEESTAPLDIYRDTINDPDPHYQDWECDSTWDEKTTYREDGTNLISSRKS